MIHWSESDEALRIRGTFRNLPPNTWDVHVHDPVHGATAGTIDVADAHDLIAKILAADVETDGLS